MKTALSLISQLDKRIVDLLNRSKIQLISIEQYKVSEKINYIITDGKSDFLKISEQFATTAQNILIIALGDVQEISDFLAANGRAIFDSSVCDDPLAQISFESFLVDGKTIYLQDTYGQYLSQISNVKILNHLRSGYYADLICLAAFKSNYNLVSIRTYIDHLLYYFAYLKDAKIAYAPIDVEYANIEEHFIISAHFTVKNFLAEMLVDSFGEINSNQPFKYILKSLFFSCDHFEITYVEETSKLCFLGFWTKSEEKKGKVLILQNIMTAKQVKSYLDHELALVDIDVATHEELAELLIEKKFPGEINQPLLLNENTVDDLSDLPRPRLIDQEEAKDQDLSGIIEQIAESVSDQIQSRDKNFKLEEFEKEDLDQDSGQQDINPTDLIDKIEQFALELPVEQEKILAQKILDDFFHDSALDSLEPLLQTQLKVELQQQIEQKLIPLHNPRAIMTAVSETINALSDLSHSNLQSSPQQANVSNDHEYSEVIKEKIQAYSDFFEQMDPTDQYQQALKEALTSQEINIDQAQEVKNFLTEHLEQLKENHDPKQFAKELSKFTAHQIKEELEDVFLAKKVASLEIGSSTVRAKLEEATRLGQISKESAARLEELVASGELPEINEQTIEKLIKSLQDEPSDKITIADVTEKIQSITTDVAGYIEDDDESKQVISDSEDSLGLADVIKLRNQESDQGLDALHVSSKDSLFLDEESTVSDFDQKSDSEQISQIVSGDYDDLDEYLVKVTSKDQIAKDLLRSVAHNTPEELDGLVQSLAELNDENEYDQMISKSEKISHQLKRLKCPPELSEQIISSLISEKENNENDRAFESLLRADLEEFIVQKRQFQNDLAEDLEGYKQKSQISPEENQQEVSGSSGHNQNTDVKTIISEVIREKVENKTWSVDDFRAPDFNERLLSELKLVIPDFDQDSFADIHIPEYQNEITEYQEFSREQPLAEAENDLNANYDSHGTEDIQKVVTGQPSITKYSPTNEQKSIKLEPSDFKSQELLKRLKLSEQEKQKLVSELNQAKNKLQAFENSSKEVERINNEVSARSVVSDKNIGKEPEIPLKIKPALQELVSQNKLNLKDQQRLQEVAAQEEKLADELRRSQAQLNKLKTEISMKENSFTRKLHDINKELITKDYKLKKLLEDQERDAKLAAQKLADLEGRLSSSIKEDLSQQEVKKLNTADNEKDQLKKENYKLQKVMEQYKQKVASLAEKIKSESPADKATGLYNENVKLNRELQNLKEELRKEKIGNGNEQSQGQSIPKKKQEDLAPIQNVVADQSRQLSQDNRRKSDQRADVENNGKSATDTTKETNDLKREKELAQKQVLSLSSENKKFQNIIKNLEGLLDKNKIPHEKTESSHMEHLPIDNRNGSKDQNNTSSSKVAEQEKQLSQMKAQLHLSQSENNKYKNKIAELNRTLDVLKRDIDQQASSGSQLLADQVDSQNEKSPRSVQPKEDNQLKLKQELLVATQKISGYENQIEQLKNQLSRQEFSSRDKQMQGSAVERDSSTSKPAIEINKTKEAISIPEQGKPDEYKALLNRANGQIQGYQSTIKELEGKLQQAQQQVQETKKISNATLTNNGVSEPISDQGQIASKEADLKKEIAKLREAEAHYKKEMAAAKAKNTQLETQMKDIQKQLDSAAKGGGGAQAVKLQQLAEQNKKMQKDMMKSKQEVEKAKKDVLKINQEKTALNNKLMSAEKELKKLQAQMKMKKKAA